MFYRRSHPLLEVTLPENVIFDVFSRLPVKAIITCKCVCKRWRDIVSDPYFIHLHLSRSSRDQEALMILECQNVQQENSNAKPVALKWVEIEHEHEHIIDTIKSLNLKQCEPPITARSVLFPIGSVNGLVSYLDAPNDSIYIFNPVLEEYMTIPPPPPAPLLLLWGVAILGYGFGVSTAGEYKVIHIFINLSETAVCPVGIVVYTLGTDQWRSLRQTPNSLNVGQIQSCGVYLNRHYYWIADHGRQIFDFDLSSETSELFPCPPVPGDNQELDRMLGVLKGRLSCICWCSSGGGVEVWVRKEESTNWYKEISVIKPVIQLCLWRDQHLCLIDGLEGTSVLLVYLRAIDKLVAYCLNTNKILSGTSISWSEFSSIITYCPSFIKLNNFGLERVHVMYNRQQPTG